MANSKNTAAAKQLAIDAIFCALIIVFSVLFSSMAYISRSVFGILIAACIGLYFSKKNFSRCAVICVAMLVLLFLFQGLVALVCIYLPNIVAGLVLGMTFRLEAKLYYAVTSAVLAVISGAEYVLYTTLMMGKSVLEAVADTFAKYDFLQIPESDFTFYSVCYLAAFFIVMAVMKTVIAGSIRRIVLKRFPKLEQFLQ